MKSFIWRFVIALLSILLMTQLQFGQVINSIPAPNYPYGLTFDGTYLWVGTSYANSADVLWKINPADGSVAGTIPVPNPNGFYTVKALGFDGQYLWVFEDLPSGSHPDKFYKVNPSTGAVLDSINSPENNYIGGMTYFNNHIWYTQYYANATSGRDVIIQMTTTGVTVDTIVSVGEQPMGIAYNGQYIWCAEDTGFGATRQEIYEYDPVTGYTGNFIKNPTASPRDMTYDGQYFWIINYASTNSTIIQFDVAGGGTPEINVPVSEINFPLTEIGQTSTFQVSIQNTGTATLDIDSLVFTNSVFSSNVAGFPVEIPQGSSALVGFTFSPTSFGTQTGTVSIYSNDPIDPVVDVDLGGKGLYSNPTIVTTANMHDFGNVWIPSDGVAIWQMGIINQGIQNLSVTNLALSDPAFSVDAPALPFNVLPDDTIMVTVNFIPQQPIQYQDVLQISSNDPVQPTYPVSLQGTGEAGPFTGGYEFWYYQVPDNPGTSFNEYRPLALKSIDDVTGDGYDDVVIATRNYWTICLNGFSSGFASEVWRFSSYISSYSAGGIGNTNDLPPQQRALAIANDLNNDGIQDVVIGTGGGNEHVYALDGTTGNILWQFGSDDPDSFSLGDITSVNVDEDFNGDNINDVIASGSATNSGLGGRRSVYCFDGTNGQMLWKKFLGCFIRMSIPVGDINGNSTLDVIAATGDGTSNSYSIVAFDGTVPNNPIWNFPIGSGDGGGRELIRYPVNGETDDVIAGAYFGTIYRIDGLTGTMVWSHPLGSLQAVHEFALLNDINGDGLKEVLVANASSSFLCLDGLTGNILWSVPLGNYSWSTSTISDLNGDGVEDVVVASRNDSLYVVDGTDGTILHARGMNSGELQGATIASALPDMDNDGLPEILGADDSGKIIALSGAVSCTPGFLGDANGDDLVNSTDGLILLSFDAGLPITPEIQQRINIGFGDVNNDGETNSTDALAVLSYDAGIPVPFPIGDPVCLPDATKQALGKTKSNNKYKGRIRVAADYHSEAQLKFGETIKIPVTIDISDIPEKLGSYTAELEWDPDNFEFEKYSGGSATGFENPVVNDTKAEKGILIFAHAYPYGADGDVNILNVYLKVIGEANSDVSLSLNFSAMAAARTFNDLLPYLNSESASQEETLNNQIPETFELKSYPNPFNPATTIQISLPERSQVSLNVFNITGQKVATLADKKWLDAGIHKVNFDGSSLPSGVYFYRLSSSSFTQTNKMILLK